jgi:hypothetical protein
VRLLLPGGNEALCRRISRWIALVRAEINSGSAVLCGAKTGDTDLAFIPQVLEATVEG